MIGTNVRPTRVRDVLVPVRRGGDALGSDAIPTGRNRRARAAAAGRLIVVRAVEAFDGDLGSMLADALKVQRDLTDAAWRSLQRPASSIMVDLSQLASIPVTVTAELSVLVDGVVRATVGATLSVEFELAALQAEVRGGWLVGLVGQQSVTARLVVDWVQVRGHPAVEVDYTVAESAHATAWSPVRLPFPIALL